MTFNTEDMRFQACEALPSGEGEGASGCVAGCVCNGAQRWREGVHAAAHTSAGVPSSNPLPLPRSPTHLPTCPLPLLPGWWSTLFMPRSYLMKHGGRKWRIWVRRAAAPDDYRFENLATRIRTNIFIQVSAH